jgi:hypothetical protein
MSVACIRRIYRSTDPETRQTPIGAIRLFELLLGAELVGVAALLLALGGVLACCSLIMHVAWQHLLLKEREWMCVLH